MGDLQTQVHAIPEASRILTHHELSQPHANPIPNADTGDPPHDRGPDYGAISRAPAPAPAHASPAARSGRGQQLTPGSSLGTPGGRGSRGRGRGREGRSEPTSAPGSVRPTTTPPPLPPRPPGPPHGTAGNTTFGAGHEAPHEFVGEPERQSGFVHHSKTQMNAPGGCAVAGMGLWRAKRGGREGGREGG